MFQLAQQFDRLGQAPFLHAVRQELARLPPVGPALQVLTDAVLDSCVSAIQIFSHLTIGPGRILVNHLLHLSDELNISDLPGVLNLLVLTLDDHLGVPGFLELSLEASNGSNRDPCVSGNGFCIRL